MLFERDTNIAELEYQKEMLEEKVKELKQAKLKLEADAVKFEAMKYVKVEKKLFLALLFSWVFFAIVLLRK